MFMLSRVHSMRVEYHFLLLIVSPLVKCSSQETSCLDTCSWTSFYSPFDRDVCLSLDSLTGNSTSPRDTTGSENQTANAVWTRQHDCIDRYCVYSNSDFFGHGISLVTTPDNYEQVTVLEGRLPEPPAGYPKFRSAKVPGKGTGLIANGTIRRGERIMASNPALLVHQNAFVDLDWEDFYELLDTAVDSLLPARRATYVDQAGQMGGHKNTDILFTNSFQISLAKQGGFHYGNFPDVSRLNHDCRPNLAFYIDEDLTHHTHAIRDIEIGEELTISYLDSFQTRALRQERTQSAFGFSCRCLQCNMPRDQVERSDMRLVSILHIENELSDINSQASSPTLIERLLSLYDEERLNFKIAGAYTLAALNYNMFNQKEMALKYAKLAVEAGLLEHGPNAPDVQAMRVLYANPEGHWSWGLKTS
ncbi:SET domain-containing protein [Whalleya microplaca]|nr:SET domain-containing protein [Whalleya microplaca]